jgi:hypothetical protein
MVGRMLESSVVGVFVEATRRACRLSKERLLQGNESAIPKVRSSGLHLSQKLGRISHLLSLPLTHPVKVDCARNPETKRKNDLKWSFNKL